MNQSRSNRRLKRWLDSWVHSDLVGIPVTLGAFAIIAISFAVYLVLGKVAGLWVGKELFVVGFGALIGLVLLLRGRRSETTEGIRRAPAAGPRRVLLIANDGLRDPELCREVCDRARGTASEALLIAPVVASSPLHRLTDDVDRELDAAQGRLDEAVATLRAAGVGARGRADIGAPMNCLVDGLREFQATEVVMLRGGEAGWGDAEKFAERVRTEVGLPVAEVGSAATPARAA